jgi:hypothetical protein
MVGLLSLNASFKERPIWDGVVGIRDKGYKCTRTFPLVDFKDTCVRVAGEIVR